MSAAHFGTVRTFVRSLFLFEFKFQTSDAPMLPDHNHDEHDRDDWPDDAENPNVDRVVADTKQIRKPKKDVYAQVEQQVDDSIS